jgi:hypothetical protein
MKVERTAEVTTITLTSAEAKLLRRVLERASFIDTPVDEQPQIASFASAALEMLAETN